MRNTFTIIALVAVLASFTACGPESKSKNIIGMIDISKSIKPAVLDWYILTTEREICANLSQYDRIKIFPIDGASQTASKPLLDLDLFEHRAEWKVMGLNANQTKQLKEEAFSKFIHSKMANLKTAIDEARIERKNVGNATDILGALEIAKSNFDLEYDNVLVLMSDMEQYADKCKMSASGKATDWLTQTAGIKYGNLNQFSIHVITGEQMAMSKQYYNEIKSFWTEFFKLQGATKFMYLGADASQLKQSIQKQ